MNDKTTEPVAWQLLEDLNIPSLERVANEKEAAGEQRIPCFLQVEWVHRLVAAWRAAPSPQTKQRPEQENSAFGAYLRGEKR